MNKVNFITDFNGDKYRLFSIIHKLDHKKEPYIKVVVPSVKDKDCNLYDGETYIQSVDQDSLFSKSGDLQINNIHELSFHYQSGVIHFKNSKNEYIGQVKNKPNLTSSKFMLVTRLVFNNLEKIDKYTKKIKSDSILLPFPFNNLGRLFEIYLTTVNIKFENEQFEKIPQIGNYVLNIANSDVHIVINEHSYFKPDLVPINISFSWFLPNR